MYGERSYSELLRDPRWQRTRRRILDRDDWRCVYCWARHRSMQVHHKHYAKGGAPWDVPDEHLITLCDECHEKVTELRRDAHYAVNEMDVRGQTNLLADLKSDGPATVSDARDEVIRSGIIYAPIDEDSGLRDDGAVDHFWALLQKEAFTTSEKNWGAR